MHIRNLQLVFVTALVGCVNHAVPLDSLAIELQHRRALPAGTPTECPEVPKSLIGSSFDKVEAALGQPDTAYQNELSYSFGSPWKVEQGVGGSPMLTFIVGDNGVVKDVLCLYSQ